MSGTPPLSQSASVRALTGCYRRCHRDPADHRGVDRAVVAKVAQADCHWLAQRARCEGTCINGAVVEHDVMGHGIRITPDNGLVGPAGGRAWIERIWAIDLHYIDRKDVCSSRGGGRHGN